MEVTLVDFIERSSHRRPLRIRQRSCMIADNDTKADLLTVIEEDFELKEEIFSIKLAYTVNPGHTGRAKRFDSKDKSYLEQLQNARSSGNESVIPNIYVYTSVPTSMWGMFVAGISKKTWGYR